LLKKKSFYQINGQYPHAALWCCSFWPECVPLKSG